MTSTQIVVTSPPGPAGTVSVNVTNDLGTSANAFAAQFTYTNTTSTLLVGGTPDGSATIYSNASGPYASLGSLSPSGPLTTDVRVTEGDINGDGIPDYIFATGPGVPFQVAVINRKDQSVLVPPFTPFTGFTGGGFVSAGESLLMGVALSSW